MLNPRIVETGQKVSSVQNLYNGRTLLLDGHPVKDASGKVAYVVTVIRDITALTELREEITAQRELLETFQNLSSEGVTGNQYPRVVQSPVMQRLYAEASAIAETDATVLLLGETGVGKDVVARHIHRNSLRADAPFIKVDCGSIPENLIETELFGYVPGSFSGASKHGKAGLVEAASTGTLFLDEIGELPMDLPVNVLSEEVGLVDRGHEDTLVVDPIDGTHNSTMNVPMYSVSLAVGRRSLLGVKDAVLLDLVTGGLFEASKSKGATLDGAPIAVRGFETKEPAMKICASSCVKLRTRIRP